MKIKDVSVIILTFNAEHHIENILNIIDSNKYKVTIVDSSSTDSTIKICKKYSCGIKIISKSDFNHGYTREMARKLYDTKITVFLTQDVIPLDSEIINKLISPLQSGVASASYARQIPRDGAKILEKYPRYYNYSNLSNIRNINDVQLYGVQLFQCSNSCAAWLNTALDEVGGFNNILTNDDYIACGKLLLAGHKVAYVADAIVKHSHNYTIIEEFQRMFDTGYVRAERPWIQDAVGIVNKTGANYFKSLMKKLLIEKPHLFPYAIIQTTAKYLGYKVGFNAKIFPNWLKKLCSGQKYYWDSKYYMK